MSWFGNAFSKVQSVAQGLVGQATSQRIANTANAALTVLTSPIQSVINWDRAQSSTASKSTLRLVAEGVTNSLAVVAPFTGSGRAAIVQVAKAILPKSTLGIAAASVALPVAVATLSTSSRARESVAFAGDSLSNVGSNIGSLIDHPSVGNVRQIFTENPVAATGLAIAATGAAAIAGKGILNLIETHNNTVAVEDNTRAAISPGSPMTFSGNQPVHIVVDQNPYNSMPAAAVASLPAPATVAATPISPGKKKKTSSRKKKKRKASKKKSKRKHSKGNSISHSPRPSHKRKTIKRRRSR